MVFPELEGSDLKKSLEILDDQGWNFDKQSQSQNRCLNADDLVPLLNLKSQQSDMYFTFINNFLLQLIKTEPILDLVEVDVTTSAGEVRPLTVPGSGDNSLIMVELINQAIANNSPQVGFLLCSMSIAICTDVYVYNILNIGNHH